MRCVIFLLIWLVKENLALIYSLNETEYARFPPLYAMDDYHACMVEPGGTYCLVDVALFSEGRSDLLRTIQSYSEYSMKHFNHTQIHRAVCVTSKCNDFILSTNKSAGLNETLERCLNNSLWTDYKLQGKLEKVEYCLRQGETLSIDASDITVAVIAIIIAMLNLVGSLYDVIKLDKHDKTGNPYLLAFSVRRHWMKMTGVNGGSSDSRLERLRAFHGMRTMTMACVFFSHIVLLMTYSYIDNPLYIEKSYEDLLKQLLFNGSLVTHTFFVMSSFLLAYNFQIYAEKHRVTWVDWPKGILLRWLRLVPTYALVLGFIMTWMRYIGVGPLWPQVVISEANACRQYWWAHLLFINNYIYDDAFCVPQTWYLAADMQLFALGLLVCVVARTARARIVALSAIFLAAIVIVAAHTYIQDLEPIVLQAPESYRNLYQHHDTFRLMYIRGHTNISTYVLGLAGGFIAYHWQTEEKDVQKFKKYRWIFWSLFPLGVGVILSGGIFYSDGSRAPTFLRVAYASLYKPIFQLLVVGLMLGSVFKIEGVYRGLMEWRGFTWTGRVSYSAFLLHTLFLRGLIGSQTQPSHISDYLVVFLLCASIFLTYLCAGILWMCLEAPAAALVKVITTPSRREESKI